MTDHHHYDVYCDCCATCLLHGADRATILALDPTILPIALDALDSGRGRRLVTETLVVVLTGHSYE